MVMLQAKPVREQRDDRGCQRLGVCVVVVVEKETAMSISGRDGDALSH